MGFLLALVLARALGPGGSGIVLQTIAAGMIGLAVARLGMDTTAVWILPRLRLSDVGAVRSACVGLLLGAGTAGAAGTAGWWLVRPLLPDSAVVDTISAVSWVLPVGSVMLVALAGTRALGGVLPFNLIGNIAVPGSRPVGLWIVTALGGGVIAAALAWAVPFLVGAVAACLVLWSQVARLERGSRGRTLPDRAMSRRLLRFALPRTLGSALEQSIVWLDVVLVGILAGAAAAGVYGASSRFVAAGVVVLTAFRVVVAPRFSTMLAEGRRGELQELYTVTAGWVLLFGGPIYVLLAIYAPAVLGLLGPGFEEGVPVMRILCTGALLLVAGGNIQSLLLMSGRSGWGAINKTIVFVVNVAGNLLLVPMIGVIGAAVSWAVCMALDTTLAAAQVRRFTGVHPALRRIALLLLVIAACAGASAGVAIALLDNTLASLAVAAAGTAALLLGYIALDRQRLGADVLASLLPIRRRTSS